MLDTDISMNKRTVVSQLGDPGSIPTVLVSWAHSDPEWDKEQAAAWISAVVQFSNLLVANGVNAELDLWHDSDPGIDWTRWGPEQVERCDFVLIAFSRAWGQRWSGTNEPTTGAGAVAEADVLKGRFTQNQQEWQRRTIVVLLPGVLLDDLPLDLHRLNRTQVPELTNEGIEQVLRTIFGSPQYEKPPLGAQPAFSKSSQDETLRPSSEDVESKRAELDLESSTTSEPTHVHFEKPSLKREDALTPAETLSADLDPKVLSLVFESWDRETALFKEVARKPTREGIVEALDMGMKSGCLSRLGPRIPIFDTEFVAVFRFELEGDQILLEVAIETTTGRTLDRVTWTEDLDETEFLARVVKIIFEQPDFDGALGFFPSSIFSGLSDLLVLASEGRKGLNMGSRHAFRRLVQVVDDYWVITEDRVFPKDQPWYTIAMNRLDEVDWVDHIRGKQWEGESGIELALEIAKRVDQAKWEKDSAS